MSGTSTDIPHVKLDEELRAAAAEFSSAVDTFTSKHDDASRQMVTRAAERALASARDPSTTWMDDAFEMSRLGATHLFQVWGGFDQIPSEGAVSFAELARKLNAETSLVERIVGVLTSQGILQAVGTDHVAHTPRSSILVPDNPLGVLYQLVWDNNMVGFFHLEEYFARYGRKEPQAMNHIPATFARGCPEKQFFEYLAGNPAYFQRFMVGMHVIESKSPAAGIYDFTWLAEKAKKEPERPVFVDVGGGRGHAILAIHQEFPQLPMERFVLQDREETINAVVAEGHSQLHKVQKLAADFHHDQPTKGAMVYFIRRCLHNYSDTLCSKILGILAGAMAGDSKLLIQEDIRPVPPDPKTAYLDFLMMTYGGKERTLQCWEQVLGNAGLVISCVSRGSGPWESLAVMECVKRTATGSGDAYHEVV